MQTLQWIGLILQVAGGLVTLGGIDSTMRQLVEGSDGLRVVRHFVRAKRRLMARFRKPTRTLVLGQANETDDDDIASLSGIVSPPDDAPVEVQLRYLTSRVERVEQQLLAGVARANKAETQLAARLGGVESSLHEQVRAVERESRQHVTGPGGSGLNVAAFGVLLATIGTVLDR